MSDKKNSTGRTKKTMKCTKERLRRAKINNYIEELRDVLKDSTPFMSLNSRYENADILEIAVNLISSNRDENLLTEKTFENGFGYCRDETLKFLQNIETRQSNRIKNVLQKCLNSGGVEESEQITYENENNLNIEMEEEQIVLRDFVHNEEFIEPLRNRVVLDKLRNKIFEKRRQRRAFQRVQMNNGENMWRPW